MVSNSDKHLSFVLFLKNEITQRVLRVAVRVSSELIVLDRKLKELSDIELNSEAIRDELLAWLEPKFINGNRVDGVTRIDGVCDYGI